MKLCLKELNNIETSLIDLLRYEKKFYEKFSCWLNLCLEYKVELCLSYDGFVRNL